MNETLPYSRIFGLSWQHFGLPDTEMIKPKHEWDFVGTVWEHISWWLSLLPEGPIV